MSAALFGLWGRLVAGACPASFDEMMVERPIGSLFYDQDKNVSGAEFGADLVLFLSPLGGDLPTDIMAPVVACADQGGIIAIQATEASAIHQAIDQILEMAGGGHA